MALTFAADPAPLEQDSHGVVRVSGTRVTLDSIIAEFDRGATPEEIAHAFPTIPLADIYSVVGYFLNHQDSVRQYLQTRLAASNAVQATNEARFDPQGIRSRLLTRGGE